MKRYIVIQPDGKIICNVADKEQAENIAKAYNARIEEREIKTWRQ